MWRYCRKEPAHRKLPDESICPKKSAASVRRSPVGLALFGQQAFLLGEGRWATWIGSGYSRRDEPCKISQSGKSAHSPSITSK